MTEGDVDLIQDYYFDTIMMIQMMGRDIEGLYLKKMTDLPKMNYLKIAKWWKWELHKEA